MRFEPTPEVTIAMGENVKKLLDSSKQLEKLTVRLNRLTFVLIVLASLAGSVGVADILLRLFMHV